MITKLNFTKPRLTLRFSLRVLLILAMLFMAFSHNILNQPRITRAALLDGVYFTDAIADPGTIYYLGNDGSTSLFFSRPSGSLTHFAIAPDETLFYSDLNNNTIYAYTTLTEENLYYTHSTYVRDLAIGMDGHLYFSSASGGGGDGEIWRLIDDPDGAIPELAYEIPLSSVNGFWRGDFSFGEDGYIYLSSGNTEPARLYRLDPNVPATIMEIYQQNEELDGVAQDQGGTFFFTTRLGGLYSLEAGLNRELVWNIPADAEIWDLNVVGLGPASSAKLFVLPGTATPGTSLRLGGYGYPGDTILDLTLEHLPTGTQINLGTALSLPSGELRANTILPLVDPGLYDLLGWQSGELLATTSLIVQEQMSLSIDPLIGEPGVQVDFTVTGLTAGELQINYDGEAILGPVPVSAGSYNSSFTVPNDRPDPPGALTTVQAINLRHGQVIGQAEVFFQSQVDNPPAIYSFNNLQLPFIGLQAGETFTISGQIDPVPQGSLADYKVLPIWKTASGKIFPIGNGPAQINLGGSFSIPAHVPSLLLGDPAPPEDGDQIGVVLISPKNQPQPSLQAGQNPWDYFTFKVKVIGKDTQQTIPGVLVSLSPWDNQIKAGSQNQVANTSTFTDPSQIANQFGVTELTEEEEWQIKLVKLLCAPQPIPANEDPYELINPTLEDAMIQASFQSLVQQSTIIQSASSVPNATQSQFLSSGGSIPSNWIHYLLTVDAIDQGYGLVDQDGLPKTYNMHVYYNPQDNTYRDMNGAVLSNPYTVELDKLPSGLLSELGPIETLLEGLLPLEGIQSPYALNFGDYYSLLSVPPNTTIPGTTKAGFLVVLSTTQYHKLSSQGMKLYLDNQFLADIDIQFNPGIICSQFKGAQSVSVPFYEGKANLSNPHLLQAGLHHVRLEAHLLGGKVVNYDYGLRVSTLPGSWFSTPVQAQRTINWKPGEVTLINPWMNSAGSQQLLSSGSETPQTGSLDNTTQANVNFTQKAEASGHKGAKTSGNTQGEAINKSGFGMQLGSSGGGGSLVSAGLTPAYQKLEALDNTFSYGPKTETLVPEITFTIPEAKAGIPFVAEVGAGGSFGYSAWATYSGNVTVKDDGSVHSQVKITPVAEINASMYISGYLLSGILAQARTTLDVVMDLGMPITYDTDTGLDTGDMCFTYRGDLTVWGGMVCVPYTDICAFEDSDVTNLFNDREPDGCSLSGKTGSALIEQENTPPPMGDIALASNGYGTVMALWQNSKNSLASSLYNGTSWSGPQIIPTGWGSHGLQLVFLSPNRALAIWTDTTLPGDVVPGMNLDLAIKTQYLAYAVWDGIGWSTPQALTTPNLGEGGVKLAACPSSSPSCPPGGAAAAVWERNLAADFNLRQIRLFYAAFQNGAWSTPQPVDPSSSSADIIPSVAYLNGAPLVAWVRDSDADLNNAASRRIALKFLNAGEVDIPANLPDAIAEVALNVDSNGKPALAFTRAEDSNELMSNERPLWIANLTCDGENCTWLPQQLSDKHGRAIYAERPRLAFDNNQQGMIAFRGLGFGPDGNGQKLILPGDSPGMVTGSGDLLKVTSNFFSATVIPAYLTSDGAVNWQPAAAYDPLLDSLISSALKGTIPATLIQSEAVSLMAQSDSPVPELPLAFNITPELPDFSVVSVVPLAQYPQPSQTLTVTVQVQNSGALWPGSEDTPLEIQATWDGVAGVGELAGATQLTSLGAGQFTEIELSLSPPAGTLDEVHTLFIMANPGLTIDEIEIADNLFELQLGGIPVPSDLSAKFKPNDGLIFLSWAALEDERIAGYRIYRSQDGGSFEPVGSSFIPGFVDLNATPGHTYLYSLSAYTEAGLESDPGDPVGINLTLTGYQVYLPITIQSMR